MHTITRLTSPRWPDPSYMGFYAHYSDGQSITGRGLGINPIAAYHAAILDALRSFHQQKDPLTNALE